ncbi:MAG: hypothetical protein K6E47_02805 [Lachnospiraceae bacterium]|nr:hypothetical protein [Lachnospiraceae bacterium]
MCNCLKKVSFVVIALISIVFIVQSLKIKAETLNIEKTELFKIDFFTNYENNTKIDMSGIKVDVYSSEITDYFKDSDTIEYTHTYGFSTYSDMNGSVYFKKPSEDFFIIIDDASLPDNTGIEIHSKFYHSESVYDKFEIYEIGKVDVYKDDNEPEKVNVDIYDTTGKKINIFYSVSNENLEENIKSLLTGNTAVNSIKVSVGNKTIHYEYPIEYSINKRLEILCDAENNNIISKSEALQTYIDIYYEYGLSYELYEKIKFLKNDSIFYNSLSESEIKIINQILSIPSHNKVYSYGRFKIFYESNSSSHPVFITSLMDALRDIDDELCGGFSFIQPKSNTSGSERFYLYVTDEINNNKAVCIPENSSGNRTSYIILYNISDLNNESTLSINSNVAHEYLHAIMHAYRDSSELSSYKWFKESWAEWARFFVYGISNNTCNEYLINLYAHNSDQSFLTNDYPYGKALFPLFLKQYYSNTTVANIVKYLSNTSNPITAINNILPGSTTFNSIFPEYMRYVYNPLHFYNGSYYGWTNHSKISANYGLNNYPSGAFCGYINSMAADYREFSVPSPSYHLETTVVPINNSSGITVKLLMTGSSGAITNWTFNSSGSIKTYSTNIGVSYTKGCVMVVNTNSTLTGYYLTITRS